MRLDLPYPVSANRYWRHFRGMTVRSADAMKFIANVKKSALTHGLRPLAGEVELCVVFHPKLTKKGAEYKRRQDLSNTIKVVEDALIGVAYADDKQVTSIQAKLGPAIIGGGLVVSWRNTEAGDRS